MRDRKYILAFFSILALVIITSFLLIKTTRSPESKFVPYSTESGEAEGNKYFSIYDNSGNLVLRTGIAISPGDEYYDHSDRHYLITKVEGYYAEARLIETQSRLSPWRHFSFTRTALAEGPIHVCLYQTHTDESFNSTDGTSSIRGNGSIMEVAAQLASGLRDNGVSVYHSYVRHDPHDINAYHRSRRTVFQLLKQRPDAIFDIHRDTAPPADFYTEINSLPSTQVMIVVGRQNSHIVTNLQFARQIKRTGDRMYPGLIKGIFIGHGNYNQDLYPTALLLEIGTETLPRFMSDKAALALSDVLTSVLRQRQVSP